MRHAARGCLCAVSALVACVFAPAAESNDPDQFEDKCIVRAAERSLRFAKTERGPWVKELEAAYPGKVLNATTEEEYGSWFDLLAGKNDDWVRDTSANAQITALYDKVTQRLELGPVPNLTRAEFLKYAKRVLMREQQHQKEEPPLDMTEEADKVFRVLDKNRDGDLDREEMTAPLKEERTVVDADGNGRISKEEYRGYFQRKVTAKAEALAKRAEEREKERNEEKGIKNTPAAKPGALPEWFTTLDTDKDGQISLFEWKQSGRTVALFNEMDLNGDGLLTKDEYKRWARMKELELDQQRRERENP